MTDIADIFAKDPLELTREDITEVIAYYRSRRAQFALGDTQAGNPKKIRKPSVVAELKEMIGDIKL